MAQAASEPFIQRFRDLLTKPVTRWDKVTRAAWVFAVLYLLAIVAQVVLAWHWPEWVRDTMNAGLAVALMVISIWYGGILTDFYSKLTGFGISEVRVDRRGANPMSTQLWIDRISGSEEIIIVGTLSRGWFVIAHESLDDLLGTSERIRLRVCLLDPFGKVWRSRIESGQDEFEDFLDDVNDVFRNLNRLAVKYGDRVRVELYDTEPISCVVARGAIYLSLYLPRVDRKEVPEFTVSAGSFLGDKVLVESVKKLRDSAPAVGAAILDEYRRIVKKHSMTSEETFWNEPEVFCDFCKELRKFPSEVSRRYPTLIDGSRIAVRKQHFFVVPSLGQLVDDHALVVSCEHVTSSARLSESAIAELTDILRKLQSKPGSEQTSQLFFEHGVPLEGSGHGGCGICHCHIHSLSIPSDYNPVVDLEKFLGEKGCKFRKQAINSWHEVRNCAKESYLCVQAGKVSPVVFIFDFDQRVESQLMRQFVAKKCPNSTKEWDWRSGTDDCTKLHAACKRLRSLFSEAAV